VLALHPVLTLLLGQLGSSHKKTDEERNMTTTFTSLLVLACLIAAILAGRILHGLLPESHLNSESKDPVKLAMGLVATMSALALGLLVSSAKGAYDGQRSEVIQMAAKLAFPQ